MLSLGPSLPSQ